MRKTLSVLFLMGALGVACGGGDDAADDKAKAKKGKKNKKAKKNKKGKKGKKGKRGKK